MKLSDYCQIRTLSIVFLGNFNPTIVQPFWLSSKGLIREHEAESAKVNLIHDELTRYDLGWVVIEISRSRFELKTSQEPYFSPVKDLAVSIFTILSETPISSFGINHIFHYAFPREDIYYEFGNRLTPLNNWKPFMKDPRLFKLEMFEESRTDGKDGSYRISIQPSDQKLSTKFAASVNINDHYSFKGTPNKAILHELVRSWDDSFSRSDDITEQIWKIVIS